MDAFNDELIEAVNWQKEYRKRSIGALYCLRVDSHGGIPGLNQKPQTFLCTNHELIIKLLTIEVILLVFVDD